MSEYQPGEIEPRWQRYWRENRTFETKRLPSGPKFYCLDMFPYPSGSGLHVGHPVGYTATDIVSRYKRMKGFSVLHPIGFDAFGLPAEQHAVRTGEHPGRETNRNCDRFLAQLEALGLSYDWSREVRTCDPAYYRWTQWIFLKLYHSWFDDEAQKARPIEELPVPRSVSERGEEALRDYVDAHRFAYYTEADVNWCPALGTVLANEEVIDGKSEIGGHEVVRKPMRQWMLRITKYAERLLSELETVDWPESIMEMQRDWIGKRHGAEIRFDVKGAETSLSCFTTRPDTLFGCTFFAVSPEHPLVDTLTDEAHRDAVEAYRDEARAMSELDRTIENRDKTGVLTGSHVVNPVNGREVPVYVGDYVLMSYGTGAVMGVPGHDERDFVFARNFGIEYIPVVVPEGADAETKRQIVEGELCYTGAGVMLPRPDPIMKELGLEGMANEEAKWRITAWLEERGQGKRVVNYRFRDWLFSRQRYWGEPFPVVHWDDGTIGVLAEDELPLLLPEIENYKPSEDGQSPLARAEDWLTVVDPQTGRKGRRETNTMPQWAGSCWYYLRFIDPHNESALCDLELEKAWMNVDLYVGGAEHAVLHLLYARFWHKVLYDLGYVSTREPFQKLFNQGMLNAPAYRDSRGALVPVDDVEEREDGSAVRRSDGIPLEKIVAKMSKSLRNVVTPDDVIAQYSADTLRLYLTFMGPLESRRVWDPHAITGIYRFLKRSWALVTDNRDEGVRDFVSQENEREAVTKAIHRAAKGVSEDIESLSLNTAIAKLMECINALSGQEMSRETTERYVKLLSPFAPHLGEELWRRLGHEDTLAYESWPSWDEAVLEESDVEVVIQVGGKKRGSVRVPKAIAEETLRERVVETLASSQFAVSLDDRFILIRAKDDAPKLINVVPAR